MRIPGRPFEAAALAAALAIAPCAAAGVPGLLDATVIRIEPPPAPAGVPLHVAVPLAGAVRVLDLEPRSIRAPDFRLLVDPGGGALVPVAPEPSRTFRGTVEGLPGSRVAASIIGGRLWASIVTADGEHWCVEPLSELAPGAAPRDHAVYRAADVVPPDRGCGTPDDPGRVLPRGGGGDGGGGAAGTGLKIAEIAADADVEYWQANASSVQFTLADIENVVAAAADIYEIEIGLAFELTTVVVRTGDPAGDPYSSAVCNTLLGQFHDAWAAEPESNIRRDLAQLFTGRDLSTCLGIAYLGSACDVPLGFGYSVVESRAPGLPFSHRTALTAHETGHSFNAPHCCAGCAGCLNPPCNIMCPCIGDCSGTVTTFGPLSAPAIVNYVNAIGCLHPLPDPLIVPVSDTFPFPVLNASTWIYVDGATVSTLAANEPSPPNALRLDAFGPGPYQDHEVRTNYINLSAFAGTGAVVRFHSEHVGAEAGERLLVEYWLGSALHRWEPLVSLTSDGVDQQQFLTTTVALDELAISPFHNQFRLRIFTDVDTPAGDLTSDTWFIDDVFIGIPPAPPNDLCAGATAVVEGSFPFTTAGAHTDGVADFCGTGNPAFANDVWFLYSPTCDGVATFSLCNAADFDTKLAVYAPGATCLPFASQACSDDAEGCGATSEVSMNVFSVVSYLVRVGAVSGIGDGTLTITCAGPCPWDLDRDGAVGVTDFLALLEAWGANSGHPADFDGDGAVGTTDFLALLEHWGAC